MLTHAHFDHIYGVAALAKEYMIPVYMHQEEMFTIENTNPYVCNAYGLPLPELFPMVQKESENDLASEFKPIAQGDIIEVGELKFEVLETPGHTRGGVCFYERAEGVLFSGDTLFAGAIGRTDHPGGDYDLLMKSIFEKLMCLDGDISVIPGHGPDTSIANERMTNPFLMPFNEPYEEK
jgi:glyoxylase-like metal-dependent hydrolase (beta-lactamase superfamily II)